MSSNDSFTTIEPPGTTPKFTAIFDFSAEALGQLKLYLEQAGLAIGINQIIGFQKFTTTTVTVFADQISGEQGTTSTTFTDLATVGPSLSGLLSGRYIVLFGASVRAPAAQTMYMGVSLNGASVDTTHVCETQTASNSSLSHAFLTSLTGTTNTVVAKYAISGGGVNGNARYRWLVALRYANL